MNQLPENCHINRHWQYMINSERSTFVQITHSNLTLRDHCVIIDGSERSDMSTRPEDGSMKYHAPVNLEQISEFHTILCLA